MSEVEKLRALLAEAQDLLSIMWQADSFAPHAYDRGDDDASVVELARHIHDRINAALAEPDWTSRVLTAGLEHEAKSIRKSHSEFLAQLQQELAEARAEVEGLKARYEMLGRLAYADVEVAEARASAAYQRGAEAMRGLAEKKAIRHNYGDLMVRWIRALPIPEDK